MGSCIPCLNLSLQSQILDLLTFIEMKENNLRWLRWTLDQSLKQHISLIINLFPRIWGSFVHLVSSWIFDQDTNLNQLDCVLGYSF